MSEPTITAESSTAPVTPFGGETTTLTSAAKAAWNEGKSFPEKPNADPAPATDQKPSATDSSAETGESDEVETSPAPEAEKPSQEIKPKRGGAEDRIKQLLADKKRLETELQQERGNKTKPPAEPSPAKPPQPQNTRPKPTTDDRDDKGEPKYKTYEEFTEDLADWKAEQRLAVYQRELAEKESSKRISEKLTDARSRYQNFDEVIKPTFETLVPILNAPGANAAVRDMLDGSEVLADLLFTIGSKPEELSSFVEMVKTNPGKAIRYIALTESLIREELETAKEKSKPEPKPPAKKETSAPPPPAEVGGRGSAPPDALEAAVASGDFRSAKREMTQRALARLKK